jgi:hypothetical protein
MVNVDSSGEALIFGAANMLQTDGYSHVRPSNNILDRDENGYIPIFLLSREKTTQKEDSC